MFSSLINHTGNWIAFGFFLIYYVACTFGYLHSFKTCSAADHCVNTCVDRIISIHKLAMSHCALLISLWSLLLPVVMTVRLYYSVVPYYYYYEHTWLAFCDLGRVISILRKNSVHIFSCTWWWWRLWLYWWTLHCPHICTEWVHFIILATWMH